MLKTTMTVEVINEPSIQVLSESEQRAFYDTLLARIFELYKSA